MRLTLHTDYAFRILVYLCVTEDAGGPQGLPTASEIASGYGISKNHLQKVIQKLAKAGILKATRGRGGGLALARKRADIGLGEVVRLTEPDLFLVECLDPPTNTCPILGPCTLTGILRNAADVFLQHLDLYTLADLAKSPGPIRQKLGINV